MLPACKSGNINTLARPATGEPGALECPTSGTNAASACNSPSTCSSGARARTVFVASTTLSISLWVALPFVEKDSIATLGSVSSSSLQESAEAMAISASSAAFGSTTIPQSANIIVPFSPKAEFGKAITKKLETNRKPTLIPMQCIAARTVCAVVLTAPATEPSAFRIRTRRLP